MKFSVIMPTFNRHEFIVPAVQSVLSQDYDDFELIIKDGGEPVLHLLPRSNHLVYIHCQDSGLGNGINQALRYAIGDIIVEANDDDYMSMDALSFVAENLGDAKWGYGRTLDNRGNLMGGPWNWDYMVKCNMVPQPSCYWKRELLSELGFWEEEYKGMAADYEWWLRIGSKYTPAYWDRVLAHYTWHDKQLSSTAYALQCEHAEVARRRYQT